jgi:hypothetical protein
VLSSEQREASGSVKKTSLCVAALHILKAPGIDLNLALNMPRVRIYIETNT